MDGLTRQRTDDYPTLPQPDRHTLPDLAYLALTWVSSPLEPQILLTLGKFVSRSTKHLFPKRDETHCGGSSDSRSSAHVATFDPALFHFGLFLDACVTVFDGWMFGLRV